MLHPAMHFVVLVASAALFTNAWRYDANAAPDVPRVNCEFPHQRGLQLAPLRNGPLVLKAIYCHAFPASPYLLSEPIVSPDGQSIAYLGRDALLGAARLEGGTAWREYPTEMGFARFGSNIRSIVAFSWASNSKLLWAATQDHMRPSGFATSPLRPVIAAEDGSLQELPPLRHDAGPLDALLWAGGDGLAVAQFGTRGSSYRPAHEDRNPTFAFVDARRGVVLDSLPFAAIDSMPIHSPAYVLVGNAAATTLPDGRVRALLSVGQWVVWTQGEAPRVMVDPYATEYHNRMVISPNGSRLLVGRLLRTDGGICGGGRMGGCRPGTPVEGILAALHDLDTGQALWTIRARVTNDFEFPTPAISQDGRYALIGLVPQATGPLIALVTMDRGQIVQTFPAPGGEYAMGFVQGGRTVWTHAHGVTALYEIRPAAN